MDVIGILCIVMLAFFVFVCVVREEKRMKKEHNEIMTFFKNANVLIEYKLECYGLTSFYENEESEEE